MNKVLVSQVIMASVFFGPGSRENGRYVQVIPQDSQRRTLRPGFQGEFKDLKGNKVLGKVVPRHVLGDNPPPIQQGSVLVDTMAG